jgi:uncharacterized protein YbjT (DUF2867 family)
MAILVTGGTGTLGRELVPVLRARDADVAVLSRQRHPQFRTADLESGDGLRQALAGVETVVHLAAGKEQAKETHNLVSAMRGAGVDRLVFVSIVGIDDIPFPYYRAKLAAERAVFASGFGVSVLRATQFHSFAAAPFLAQRRWPVMFAPRLNVQPIDVRVVATKLADLALDEPRGRVEDMGGPQLHSGRELATAVAARFGRHPRIVEFGLPGRTWDAFADGYHLAPQHKAGGRTFAEYLDAL